MGHETVDAAVHHAQALLDARLQHTGLRVRADAVRIAPVQTERGNQRLRLEDVAHVDHPDVFGAVVLRPRDQLPPHEGRRRRADVRIGIRVADVGDFPKHAAAVRTLGAAEPADVAETIVRPDHDRIARNDLVEPRVIERHRVVVERKDDLDVLAVSAALLQQSHLRRHDLPLGLDSLGVRASALTEVAGARHAKCPKDVTRAVTRDRGIPILGQEIRMLGEVPHLAVLHVVGVSHHRLARAGPDGHVHLERQLDVRRTRHELITARAHRRPDRIDAILLHHREDLAISVDADLLLVAVMLTRPRTQSPVLITDKDTSIVDRTKRNSRQ